jgi:hypothetical protein
MTGIEPEGYRLEPVHLEMKPGLGPDPIYPGDDAPEPDRLAWYAGHAAIEVGYPISVVVAFLPHQFTGGVYGFVFHYTNPSDGVEWAETTQERMTYDEARLFLQGADFAARFMKHRQGNPDSLGYSG